MYINYDGLHKLMNHRGIKKQDLIVAAKISSRTAAKLSRNESVTLETLLRICEVLNCNIGDIVSFDKTQSACSLYYAYKKETVPVYENDYFKTFSIKYNDKNVEVSVTKKTADKYTVIRLFDNIIEWDQLSRAPRLVGATFDSGEKTVIQKVSSSSDGIYRLFIIAGKPAAIYGLDEGMFRSARHPGGSEYMHVMSMSAFKCFEI